MAKRAPDGWTGGEVQVAHHIDNSGALTVGLTSGVLEEVDKEGLVLRVPATGQQGKAQLLYFPRTSVVWIAHEEEEGEQ